MVYHHGFWWLWVLRMIPWILVIMGFEDDIMDFSGYGFFGDDTMDFDGYGF